jgi:hypothetical protein
MTALWPDQRNDRRIGSNVDVVDVSAAALGTLCRRAARADEASSLGTAPRERARILMWASSAGSAALPGPRRSPSTGGFPRHPATQIADLIMRNASPASAVCRTAPLYARGRAAADGVKAGECLYRACHAQGADRLQGSRQDQERHLCGTARRADHRLLKKSGWRRSYSGPHLPVPRSATGNPAGMSGTGQIYDLILGLPKEAPKTGRRQALHRSPGPPHGWRRRRG